MVCTGGKGEESAVLELEVCIRDTEVLAVAVFVEEEDDEEKDEASDVSVCV